MYHKNFLILKANQLQYISVNMETHEHDGQIATIELINTNTNESLQNLMQGLFRREIQDGMAAFQINLGVLSSQANNASFVFAVYVRDRGVCKSKEFKTLSKLPKVYHEEEIDNTELTYGDLNMILSHVPDDIIAGLHNDPETLTQKEERLNYHENLLIRREERVAEREKELISKAQAIELLLNKLL